MPKKIKKSFFWIQKALQVLGQRTTLPNEVGEIIQPVIDTFGWERLAGRTDFAVAAVAAPGIIVNGPITPDGVLRLYLNASVKHTDTGVTHFIWIDLDMRGASAELVGVTNPNVAVPVSVDQSTDRWLAVAPTHRLRARADVATVAGALTMSMNFIDLPIGEYIPTV